VADHWRCLQIGRSVLSSSGCGVGKFDIHCRRRPANRSLSCQQEKVLELNRLGDQIWYVGMRWLEWLAQVMGSSARMYENH
jgi:hypothetical protein